LGGADEPSLGAVQAALVPAADHLSVLAGQSRTLEPFQPPAGRLAHLVRALRQLATFAVVDMPYTFDPHYFEALAHADRVLLVGRQDVPGVEAAGLLKRAIADRGIAAPALVLNRYEPDRPEFACARIGELLGVGSVVPVAADAPACRAAANAGRPLREVAPTSPAVADLRAIALDVLHTSGLPPHLPRQTLWDRARTFLTRLRN
jgi:Flp pilus assembly CpaE family ATPase